jgi:hypothetical protein
VTPGTVRTPVYPDLEFPGRNAGQRAFLARFNPTSHTVMSEAEAIQQAISTRRLYMTHLALHSARLRRARARRVQETSE